MPVWHMPGPQNHLPAASMGSIRSSLFSLLFTVALWLHPPLFFFPPTMPLSHFSSPNASHEIKDIQVILIFCVLKAMPKKDSSRAKKSVAKGKIETKTKELSFTFELSDKNYFLFLSALLKVHGPTKYAPVKKHTRFGIRCCWEKKCASPIIFYFLIGSLFSVQKEGWH